MRMCCKRAPTSIREHAPVGAAVAPRLEEGNEGLADGHVVGRGVVVQLLVPVLHPSAALLPNVVAVHDVQDLIPHGLQTQSSAECWCKKPRTQVITLLPVLHLGCCALGGVLADGSQVRAPEAQAL